MILIGLGANLPGPGGAPPCRTLESALRLMEEAEVRLLRRSRWYQSAPIPPSDQPLFVNGVAEVATALAPEALLALLHDVERRLGRARRVRWEARVIDLDLLAYDDRVVPAPASGGGLELPHPRLHERAFVLVPLAEIAPAWRHPATGRSVGELIALLPADQVVEPLAEGEAPGA